MHLFQRFEPCSQGICYKFKPLDANDCTLKPNRIDIWQFPLHHLSRDVTSLLNESETERAARYYFERHRRRFSVARTTLRLILAQYLKEQAPHQLIFKENKYGKPALQLDSTLGSVDNSFFEALRPAAGPRDPEILLNAQYDGTGIDRSGSGEQVAGRRDLNCQQPLTFNLSHSKDLALLAVGSVHDVGIDLEFFSARSYLGIGDQLFSEQENQAFKKIITPAQALSFFHIWAQKEAFIKACGLGLSYPTQDFSVLPLPPVTSMQILDKLEHQPWQMTSFMPQVACSAAVCYHPNVQEIRYLSIRPKETQNRY